MAEPFLGAKQVKPVVADEVFHHFLPVRPGVDPVVGRVVTQVVGGYHERRVLLRKQGLHQQEAAQQGKDTFHVDVRFPQGYGSGRRRIRVARRDKLPFAHLSFARLAGLLLLEG